jgi:sulfur relay (sulfurtransferase) DsrC/TusE family protein
MVAQQELTQSRQEIDEELQDLRQELGTLKNQFPKATPERQASRNRDYPLPVDCSEIRTTQGHSQYSTASAVMTNKSIWSKGQNGLKLKPLPVEERFCERTVDLQVWLRNVRTQIERAGLTWEEIPSVQKAEFILYNCSAEVQLALNRLGMDKPQGEEAVINMLKSLATPRYRGTNSVTAILESKQSDNETSLEYIRRVVEMGQSSQFMTEKLLVTAISQGIRCERDHQAVSQLITNYTMQHQTMPPLQMVTKHLQSMESLNFYDGRPAMPQRPHQVMEIREDAEVVSLKHMIEVLKEKLATPIPVIETRKESIAESEVTILKKQVKALTEKLKKPAKKKKVTDQKDRHCTFCDAKTHNTEQCWFRMEEAGFDMSFFRKRKPTKKTESPKAEG